MELRKILHIPNYYPPHIGGIEDVCHSIVAGLPGYDHQVICFNDKKYTEKDVFEGVKVIRTSVVKKLFSQSISFSFLKELRQIFKDFNPDIVHFHTPNPLSSVYLLLAIPKNTKLIIHWHSDIVEQGLLYVFYHPIEKMLLKRADKILVTSPSYLSASKPLRDWNKKAEVIANTINTEKLQKKEGDEAEIQKIKDLYGGKKIIFTFGRHVPYKGLKYLIEALPLISDDAVVVIAGKGPLTDKLKKSTTYPSVYFTGRLSDDELRYYLYASYLFAFPSITRNEAFGVALAEAMYCGLPSVTFTIPGSGVNWVSVDKLTGIEVENSNTEKLADAINQLIKTPSLRDELGVNAFNRACEEFTVDAIEEKLTNLYKL